MTVMLSVLHFVNISEWLRGSKFEREITKDDGSGRGKAQPLYKERTVEVSNKVGGTSEGTGVTSWHFMGWGTIR
jgi:hypothetical protein